MDSLNDLRAGYLYFYTFDGAIAIGEYIEEWERGDIDDIIEAGHEGLIERYLAEIWCDTKQLSYTYLRGGSDDLIILKEVGNAYEEGFDFDQVFEELKEEFPEYFI